MDCARTVDVRFSDRARRSTAGAGSVLWDCAGIVSRIWSTDTSNPTGAGSPSNPAKNHCSVTSLIVQDHFGGEILSTRTPGGTHFHNLVDGARWDLTVSQFAEPVPYDDAATSRAAALASGLRKPFSALPSARYGQNRKRRSSGFGKFHY